MRYLEIATGKHYHVYNRGNNKQSIFLDDGDRARFLFLILYFQAPVNFQQINRVVKNFSKKKVFEIDKDLVIDILRNRYIKLESFALMQNHFHIMLNQIKPDGISQYMQRVLNSYTKYFNTKYEKAGHLFQGPYKIVHVESNEQFLHLSAYIHRNPREIKQWHKKEHLYPWSSYQDFIGNNRWGNILSQTTLLEQFKNANEYRKFVETSGTKDLHIELKLD